MSVTVAPVHPPALPRLSGGALAGVLLCVAIALLAIGVQQLQIMLFGRAWLEALVLAILVGMAVRTAWTPPAAWAPGLELCGRYLLEIAVALLGATITASAVLSAGPALPLAVAGLVLTAIAASYGLSRLCGLHHKLALLVACGNSICGNSAIAAVSPAIGADGDDTATAIGLTAILSIGVVLGLPVLGALMHMTPRAYGALAGLTVYSAPQVLAATAPVSLISAQFGTFAKLMRIAMLGPVVFGVAFAFAGKADAADQGGRRRFSGLLRHALPWYVAAFLALVAARSFGVIPQTAVAPAGSLATSLTIVSMAALGLGLDIRVLARTGPRVLTAALLSLLTLGALALLIIGALRIV